MTTAMRENPNLRVHAQEPSEWCGRSKHILLTQRGWKVRKIPAMGRNFLLTFPFIELIKSHPLSVGHKLASRIEQTTYRSLARTEDHSQMLETLPMWSNVQPHLQPHPFRMKI